MNNLFQYVPGNSLIHRLNPVTKIFLTIVICAAAIITNQLWFLGVLLAVDLLIGKNLKVSVWKMSNDWKRWVTWSS